MGGASPAYSHISGASRKVRGSCAYRGYGGPSGRKIFQSLDDIYLRSDFECETEIVFNQGPQGEQNNACRNLVVDYLRHTTLVRGRRIAARLQNVTTHRSGLGLLFLITGTEGLESKIIISRFPADEGILAEANREALTVEFLERIFVKNARAYKEAAYQHASLDDGFWFGRSVDKQISGSHADLSNYWIKDFLDSDYRTTAASGTRRLALAIREALRGSEDAGVKREIVAAATLAPGIRDRNLSIRSFGEQLHLSERARQAIIEAANPNLIDERFRFDAQEYDTQLPYRSVELDNGAVLTAQLAGFDEVFDKELGAI